MLLGLGKSVSMMFARFHASLLGVSLKGEMLYEAMLYGVVSPCE